MGAGIYICFRSTAIGLIVWGSRAGLGPVVESVRSWAAPISPLLPEWCVHSLPDGLWCYAATATLAVLWHDLTASPALRAALAGAGLLTACAMELLQGIGVMRGTADLIDILFSCLGWAAAMWAVAPGATTSHRQLTA